MHKSIPTLITGSPLSAESWTSWRSDGGGGRKLKVGGGPKVESWEKCGGCGRLCATPDDRLGSCTWDLHCLCKNCTNQKLHPHVWPCRAWFWVSWLGKLLSTASPSPWICSYKLVAPLFFIFATFLYLSLKLNLCTCVRVCTSISLLVIAANSLLHWNRPCLELPYIAFSPTIDCHCNWLLCPRLPL